MDDILLKEFLKIIGYNTSAFDTSKAEVWTEAYLGSISEDKSEGGRADIFLSYTNLSAIVIENKIYATDQECQLVRYDNYLAKNFTKNDSLLIYLTLEGTRASKYSTPHEVECTSISYKQHILKWLERCVMLAFDKPLVRETIMQYRNTIKTLCNMVTPNRRLIDIALQDNNIEATLVLLENQSAINCSIVQIRCDFIELLKRELGAHFRLEEGEEENLKSLSNPEGGIMFKVRGYDSEWVLSILYENHVSGMMYTITKNDTGNVEYKEVLDCPYLWKDNPRNQHYPLGARFF